MENVISEAGFSGGGGGAAGGRLFCSSCSSCCWRDCTPSIPLAKLSRFTGLIPRPLFAPISRTPRAVALSNGVFARKLSTLSPILRDKLSRTRPNKLRGGTPPSANFCRRACASATYLATLDALPRPFVAIQTFRYWNFGTGFYREEFQSSNVLVSSAREKHHFTKLFVFSESTKTYWNFGTFGQNQPELVIVSAASVVIPAAALPAMLPTAAAFAIIGSSRFLRKLPIEFAVSICACSCPRELSNFAW